LYRLSLTLDAFLKFGTLAERTDKQPGVPGTQPASRGYSSLTRRNPHRRRSAIERRSPMTTATTLLTRYFAVLAIVMACTGCGDSKMRKRIAALDDATLTRLLPDYEEDSKPAVLIREEIARRGVSLTPPRDKAAGKPSPQPQGAPLEVASAVEDGPEPDAGQAHAPKDNSALKLADMGPVEVASAVEDGPEPDAGQAHAPKDNSVLKLADMGPVLAIAWCASYNNFAMGFKDIRLPTAFLKEVFSRRMEIIGRMAEGENANRSRRVREALGMTPVDWLANIINFCGDDLDAFLKRADALAADNTTRQLALQLEMDYKLFLLLASGVERDKGELYARIRQAVPRAGLLARQIGGIEPGRLAIAIAKAPHDVATILNNITRVTELEERHDLAAGLGKERWKFVVETALSINDPLERCEQARLAIGVAKELAGLRLEQQELANAAFTSHLGPEEYAAKVRLARGSSELAATAGLTGLSSGLCAALAGNSLHTPDVFLKRLGEAFAHKRVAPAAESAEVSREYLAIMIAESDQNAGEFLGAMERMMQLDDSKEAAAAFELRRGQAAAMLVFARMPRFRRGDEERGIRNAADGARKEGDN
jgi:hypothetical protein